MKILLLLRHAKSSWDDPSLPDHERPLNDRGLKDAPRMGKLLYQQSLKPDLIISSTAKRAQDTATLVARHSEYKGQIQSNPQLYESSPDKMLNILTSLSDDHRTVLLVVHNPDLELLVQTLTGESVELPTAALVEISLPIEQWQAMNLKTKAAIKNIWRPKELKESSS